MKGEINLFIYRTEAKGCLYVPKRHATRVINVPEGWFSPRDDDAQGRLIDAPRSDGVNFRRFKWVRRYCILKAKAIVNGLMKDNGGREIHARFITPKRY